MNRNGPSRRASVLECASHLALWDRSGLKAPDDWRSPKPAVRFMESPLSPSRMHRDHEPKTRKWLEINVGVFRFMESLLGHEIVHWDHEPTLSYWGTFADTLKAILPLPRGEGWGEGNFRLRFIQTPLRAKSLCSPVPRGETRSPVFVLGGRCDLDAVQLDGRLAAQEI